MHWETVTGKSISLPMTVDGDGLIVDPAPPGADLKTKIAARGEAIDRVLGQCATLAQFGELMDTLDIPWGEVRDPRNLHEQPTLQSRGMIVEIDDRAGGTRPMADSPYRFSDARSGVRGPAAHRGEHNREVLKDWLQLADGEIDELADSGIMNAGSSDSPAEAGA